MNRTRSQLLRFLIAFGPGSCEDVSLALGLSRSTVRRQMALLRGAGVVTLSAGRFTAQLDQIEQQLRELSAMFQTPTGDFGNPTADASQPRVRPFHLCERPETSKEIS
ncbi:winged helix-turn-helix domain-containing protein [Pseudarthrobacter sp. NIBRBAC000502770]|uniref:winged helix-turn-helix domain-containing protein n=1 Tax=Pseudarthrobacter sp. NIBRBAC000502770 TaxID=2590785 RepID=UPI00352B32DF